MSPVGQRTEPRTGPRLAATLLLGFLFSVLSTTLFAWWAVGPLRLSPLVVVVVSAGFRLPLVPGGAAVLFLGYLADLLSGGAVGLQLTALVVIFLLCTAAQRQLAIDSIPFQAVSVWLMTALNQALLVGGLVLMNRGQLIPANLPWVVAAQATLGALTAPVFFWMLEALARMFERVWPKRKQV